MRDLSALFIEAAVPLTCRIDLQDGGLHNNDHFDFGFDAPSGHLDSSPSKSLGPHNTDIENADPNCSQQFDINLEDALEFGLPEINFHPHASKSPSRSNPPVDDQAPFDPPDAALSPYASPDPAANVNLEQIPEGLENADANTPDAAVPEPPKRAPKRRRAPVGARRKRLVKLYADPERTTIPSAEYRAAIAHSDYSDERPPLQVQCFYHFFSLGMSAPAPAQHIE